MCSSFMMEPTGIQNLVFCESYSSRLIAYQSSSMITAWRSAARIERRCLKSWPLPQ